MWQVDMNIAPFRVPFVVNYDVGAPAFVSCIIDLSADGRRRANTTGNVYHDSNGCKSRTQLNIHDYFYRQSTVSLSWLESKGV